MAQFLRPDSNITQTSYTGGFAEIDETTASDADLAFGGVNSALPLLLNGLSNPASTPQSGTCTVRWRSAKRNAAGTINSGNNFTGTCTLLQGTTTIASDAYTPGAFATRTFTFTHSSITDWNDLRLQFTQTASAGTGNNRSGLAVSWAEVEVPDGLNAYSLVADKGTFTLSGKDAGVVHAATLGAAVGTFTLTGKDATLVKKKALIADKGTFSLSGQAAGLRVTRLLTASARAFGLTGINAAIAKGATLIGSTRAFYVTGNSATFIYSGGASTTKKLYYQSISADPRKDLITPTLSEDQLVYYINNFFRIL